MVTPLANVLQPLIDVFASVLLFFHDTVGFGWGLSIIALTVSVRALLIPLTLKQFRSMRALQAHMPEMKAIQEKYKEDRQRLNQEMMKFYQENSINPFASCLPLIAQLPVFIALFYMLREDLKVDICGEQINRFLAENGGKLADTTCTEAGAGNLAGFWFIPDLTAAGTGWVLAVLIVLYIGSQLLSSILMSVTADKNQRMIMIALPFVFTLFIINFPAGLILYWITTNFWTVGQSYIIRKTSPPPVVPGKDGKGKDAKDAFGNTAVATAGATNGGSSSPASKPPPPPRKKKKKTGRRR